jgi:hypothetical protein
MSSLRFSVFGRIISVERQGTSWKVHDVGSDGKRSPAAFVIPDFIEAQEIDQYLFDLFHESATPGNGDVRQIE